MRCIESRARKSMREKEKEATGGVGRFYLLLQPPRGEGVPEGLSSGGGKGSGCAHDPHHHHEDDRQNQQGLNVVEANHFVLRSVAGPPRKARPLALRPRLTTGLPFRGACCLRARHRHVLTSPLGLLSPISLRQVRVWSRYAGLSAQSADGTGASTAKVHLCTSSEPPGTSTTASPV
jgi:hypothetical protein